MINLQLLEIYILNLQICEMINFCEICEMINLQVCNCLLLKVEIDVDFSPRRAAYF